MKSNTLANILACIWIISWFLMIWITQYRGELFWTGLFAIILAVGSYEECT